jgi:hypothetical protein
MQNIIELPAPVFATEASARLSDKYGFIPTHELVDNFRRNEWEVVGATTRNVRKPENRGFQKHLLRFAHRSQLDTQRTERIETIVINSHDGTTSLQIAAGVFRMACANGLIVADSTVASVRLGHHRLAFDKVLEGAETILSSATLLNGTVEQWKNLQVDADAALHLAEAGINLRWGSVDNAPVTPHQVAMTTRRDADTGGDLWTTFNRIQENVLRNGLKATQFQPGRTKMRRSPRTLKDLDATAKVNRGLWEAASGIALLA